MKTNFKKLALVAGVTAAMAGGSMSAHAVIQAVPAPAVLIPLFATQDTLPVGGGAIAVSGTSVRIEIPASVGVDSVVNLFAAPVNGGASAAVPNTGLALAAPTAATALTSRLHWFFMDPVSNEIANSNFPVSANDVLEFTDQNMPNSNATTTALGQAQTGYLVIVNESAVLGGAPLFSFQADAFLTTAAATQPNTNVVVNNIPVIPLSDSADGTSSAPSLTNNVLESVVNVPAGSGYGNGPIVSPMISGVRLGFGSNSGAVAATYRVIDFPVVSTAVPGAGNALSNITTWVAWNDRNTTERVVNGAIQLVPGLTGSITTYDCNENPQSAGGISLNQQLTFLSGNVTANTAANVALYADGSTGPQLQNHVDGGYSELVANAALTGTTAPLGANYVTLPLGNAATCRTANPTGPGGFVRWFTQPNTVNVAEATSGAVQAGVFFRLKSASADGYSQFPVDRGTFSGL